MRSVTFYNFLLEATLTGSILILLLLLARVTIGKRISRLAVYAAWLLVAVRLLLPFSFPNPLMNELRPRLSGNYAARPIADQIRVRTIDAVYDASVAMAGNDVTELDESRLFQLAVSLEKGLLGNMLLIVYCGGAATTLGVLLSRNLRFRRRLRKARVEMIPMEQLGEYVQRCSALHIRPLPVWRVEGLPASCVAGLMHPFLALPANIRPESYSLALTHELAHLRMHDGWWNLLRCLCCVIHWFNPLVWLGASVSRTDGEIACDQWTIQHLPAEAGAAYRQKLDGIAWKHSVPELGVQASGVAMKPKRVQLRQRLLQAGNPSRVGTALFLSLAVAVAVFSFFTGEKEYSPSVEDSFLIMADITQPQERVQRQVMETQEDAVAWFQRLMGSSFIQADADAPVSMEWQGEKWQGSCGAFTATFNNEGVITALRNAEPLEVTLKDVEILITSSRGEALYGYLRAFTKTCLPDVTITQLKVTQAEVGSSGSFLTCEGGHKHCDRAYRFVVQLEPQLRVLSFSLLDTEERALIRVSGLAGGDTAQSAASPMPTGYITMAQAREIAQDRVTRAGGAAEIMSSVSKLDESDPEQPMWIVTYNLSGDPHYEVRMDATNGEVLLFVDHQEKTVQRSEDEEGTPAPDELSKAEAIALARKAVVQAYGFSEQEVAGFLVADARYKQSGTSWCGYIIPTQAWLISLRMPETDLAMISDYDVVLDAATGEVLHIFDPSNNANG